MIIYCTLNALKSDILIKKALAHYAKSNGIQLKEDYTVKKNNIGKPFIDNPDIKISVTHSGDLTAVGIGDFDIGIDAEKIKKIDYSPIIRKFNIKHNITDNLEFLHFWTQKEAQAKLYGISVIDSLRIDFPQTLFISLHQIKGYVMSIASITKINNLKIKVFN